MPCSEFLRLLPSQLGIPQADLILKQFLRQQCRICHHMLLHFFEMFSRLHVLVAVTHRGTRPGDPIGDVAFNLAMAMIMQHITELLGPQERSGMETRLRPRAFSMRLFLQALHVLKWRMLIIWLSCSMRRAMTT